MAHEAGNLQVRNIAAAVTELGLGGSSPFLDGEFSGGECRIFKLSFADHASVAVRVRHASHDTNHENHIAMVEDEVETLQQLQAKGFAWAPKCLGASLTFGNLIKSPFSVLTWIDGCPLQWDKDFPPRPLRDEVLGKLASIQLSLMICTLTTRPITARAYYERRLRNRQKRVANGELHELSEQDCLDQQAFLENILGEDGESTAFAMAHGDLKPSNIIVDEQYSIKGIIDWGFAEMVPIATAALFPTLLWPDESARRAPSQATLRDRQTYIDSYSSQTSLAALAMRRWQAAGDVDFRILYLTSISSKGVHKAMAQIGWKFPYCTSAGDAEVGNALGIERETKGHDFTACSSTKTLG
ncbi:kinase-like domain-containing protein [Trichoderma aethiopicum]